MNPFVFFFGFDQATTLSYPCQPVLGWFKNPFALAFGFDQATTLLYPRQPVLGRFKNPFAFVLWVDQATTLSYPCQPVLGRFKNPFALAFGFDQATTLSYPCQPVLLPFMNPFAFFWVRPGYNIVVSLSACPPPVQEPFCIGLWVGQGSKIFCFYPSACLIQILFSCILLVFVFCLFIGCFSSHLYFTGNMTSIIKHARSKLKDLTFYPLDAVFPDKIKKMNNYAEEPMDSIGRASAISLLVYLSPATGEPWLCMSTQGSLKSGA